MSTRPCRICASKDTAVKYEFARDYITYDIFRVLQCRSCTAAFTDPFPDDLGRYYPSRYRAYKAPVLWVLGALYRAKVGHWSRQFVKPGDALEVGCGPGIMLRELRHLGWQVTGTERTPEVAGYGRDTFGLNIIAGSIRDLPPTQSFDLIILFQVLEHIDDPRSLLADCFERLNPGGRIVVSVPNLASWQAGFGRNLWLHLDVPRHLIHFTPRSLELLLQRVGFANVRMQFNSFEHDPIGWVQSVLNRVFTPANALIRYLMGLDPLNIKVVGSVIIGSLIALLSIPMSMVSWACRSGAIVTVIARKVEADAT